MLTTVLIAANVVLLAFGIAMGVNVYRIRRTKRAERAARVEQAAREERARRAPVWSGDGIPRVPLAQFDPAFAPDEKHVHFFWDTTPRETAGTNGVPEQGEWLPYAGTSPVADPFFDVDARPEGATAICALVATHEHAIADVDGDGEPDPDTGNCVDLP